ncbi:MAG TPA: TIGR03960 family B12-binding radical SAM protein [Oscillospiraceae bacterium]|nr:TIGR03960 family B12-binding radical SAM protein [Oscillospiraceae bacterium]HNW03953.1 TIGR03960 family B12-binding radical SAM protein [Oscillospiraceae bacterium]
MAAIPEKIFRTVEKPARYTGGELNSVVKKKEDVKVRFAFCFPDLYEVGMSHLGMKILYSLLNKDEEVWCERVFAPDVDLEKQLRENGLPLFAIESRDSLADFDMIGFTLQYELCYTGVLNMLDLAGVPVRREDRKGLKNLVVAGGPCACNPEPMADFIDLFMPGEGEEVLPEIVALYKKAKDEAWTKEAYLARAARIPGVYIPSLYEVEYNEDGTIRGFSAKEGAPMPVKKRIIKDLDKVFFPENFVVPFIDIVHDRSMLEIMRGCVRGCRFCQAGFLYRPVREKTPETLCRNARGLCDSTGYEELSLTSLSTSDYSKLEPLLDDLLPWTEKEYVNIAVPSLRIDNFSESMLEKITKVRKSGLTFAAEAGTQRMRDVINKNVTEEDILGTCRRAFEGGYTSVKLYFMIGLPTETDEDVLGVIDTAQKVVDLYYSLKDRPKGKAVQVTCSVASFVPKPFTPFEFEPQDTMEELQRKQQLMLHRLHTHKISLDWHNARTSFIEAVFARGDRRLGKAVEWAWRHGCNLDGWDEHFKFDVWLRAFAENGLDPAFYANRRRPFDETLPWELMDYGVSKEFFIRENEKARSAATTPNCRQNCSGCGIAALKGGPCFE